MNNIAKIISIFGGAKGIYASVENPPYMRLVIEDIGQGPRGHQAISVAHYFEQNGDLCQDPEMTFELIPEGANVRYEPLSFQQALPPSIRRSLRPDPKTFDLSTSSPHLP